MRSEEHMPAAQLPALVDTSVHVEAETVPVLEEITLRVDQLRAARLCIEKPSPYSYRRHLTGVYVHRTDDGFVRVVGGDGSRLFVANAYREHADRPGPEWLTKGVIIPGDHLDGKLAILAKAGSRCTLTFAQGHPWLELSTIDGAAVFRLQPIAADYVPYQGVMNGWGGAFGDGERGEFHPTAFDAKHFKQVGDVAGRLDAKQVTAYASPQRQIGKGLPVPGLTAFTFGGGVALFLQPKVVTDQMGEADRVLLAPAIKASVAALKAHETRQRKAAKKATGAAKVEALARADAFKRRLEELQARAGDGVVAAALPAPVPPPPPPPPQINDAIDDDTAAGEEGPTAADVAAVEQPTEKPPAPQVEEPVPVVEKVVERQGARKGGRAKKRAAAKKAKR